MRVTVSVEILRKIAKKLNLIYTLPASDSPAVNNSVPKFVKNRVHRKNKPPTIRSPRRKPSRGQNSKTRPFSSSTLRPQIFIPLRDSLPTKINGGDVSTRGVRGGPGGGNEKEGDKLISSFAYPKKSERERERKGEREKK